MTTNGSRRAIPAVFVVHGCGSASRSCRAVRPFT